MVEVKNMKIKKSKTVVITLLILIILLAIPIQNVAMIQPADNPSKQIQVKIYNVADQSMRIQKVDFETFISFFEPIENLDENNAQHSFQLKMQDLQNSQLINDNEKKLIQQITSSRVTKDIDMNSEGLFFDLLNVFNGFGFAIKGEKTRSFLDLTVAQFPFLNTNITALFSGFNSFDGNGFIFTLGTNGFRYIYDYDRDTYDFPYFGSIKGWFIGYTGIILEATISDALGETYEGTYIIGVGMNVITLWND